MIEFEQLSSIEQEEKVLTLQTDVEQTLQHYLQTASSRQQAVLPKQRNNLFDITDELDQTAHELNDLLNATGYKLSKLDKESIKLNIRAIKNNTIYQFSVPYSTWKETLAQLLPHIDTLTTAGDFFRIQKLSTW